MCIRVKVCVYVFFSASSVWMNLDPVYFCSRLFVQHTCTARRIRGFRTFYISVHLSFLRFDLSLARPFGAFESSVFRERISRIKSKNTCFYGSVGRLRKESKRDAIL